MGAVERSAERAGDYLREADLWEGGAQDAACGGRSPPKAADMAVNRGRPVGSADVRAVWSQ